MTDTELLDAFEKKRSRVYFDSHSYRGVVESGWTYWSMFGPEGPIHYPTLREAMLAVIQDPEGEPETEPLAAGGVSEEGGA